MAARAAGRAATAAARQRADDRHADLPPPDRLVFYAVLGALGALEIIEWPIALVVGVGHYLTEQRFSPALQEAGQAAEIIGLAQ